MPLRELAMALSKNMAKINVKDTWYNLGGMIKK